MNALSTFNFRNNSIRVVQIDGQPRFVAQDICCVLYDAAHVRAYGPSCHTQFLASDEKRRVWANDADYRDLFTGLRRVPSMSLISESGLYKLIMRSDKPQAKEFQDWVTREVLPSIRKNGGYIMGQETLGQPGGRGRNVWQKFLRPQSDNMQRGKPPVPPFGVTGRGLATDRHGASLRGAYEGMGGVSRQALPISAPTRGAANRHRHREDHRA